MKNLKVTIIIPVYNVESYIERCARSLYGQTYSNIEYIWVNDATPDNSIQILRQITEEYPQRKKNVRILDHSVNKGLTIARRTGLEAARGEYIYHCDSDDWADSGMIKELLECAQFTDADIVWCDFYKSDTDNDIIVKQGFAHTSKDCIKELLTQRMHGGYWNKLIRRNLYLLNDITFSLEANMCEDLRGTVQLFYYAERVSYCPKAFYHYVLDNQGSMCATFSPEKMSDLLTNIDAILKFFEDKNIVNKLANGLNCLKHLGKRALLTTTDIKNFRRWRTIYPEANKHILSYTALPVTLRLIGWCVYMQLWLPVRIWIYLKRIKNHIG